VFAVNSVTAEQWDELRTSNPIERVFATAAMQSVCRTWTKGTYDPAVNARFDGCALGNSEMVIHTCGSNERPRALCCGTCKHKIGALLFGGRARRLYGRPRGWERLRSVVDAICSKVLPSRNQTVALRAPDSSFLIERDHRLTDERADPAMMLFDPQRGWLAYVMLALGFVAIAES
jgi:hypothetical protein